MLISVGGIWLTVVTSVSILLKWSQDLLNRKSSQNGVTFSLEGALWGSRERGFTGIWNCCSSRVMKAPASLFQAHNGMELKLGTKRRKDRLQRTLCEKFSLRTETRKQWKIIVVFQNCGFVFTKMLTVVVQTRLYWDEERQWLWNQVCLCSRQKRQISSFYLLSLLDR